MLSALETLLSFLFPKRCALCTVEGSRLCDMCVKNLPKSEQNSESWIMSAFSYKHEAVRTLLRIFKYKHDRDCRDFFGARCAEVLLEEIANRYAFDAKRIVCIPIPMSKKRLYAREENSAKALACAIYPHIPFPKKELATNLLRKVRETKPQTKTESRNERIQNIAGSFLAENISPEPLYILVDDVTTTGATMKEAWRTLKKAGARDVLGITIAH